MANQFIRVKSVTSKQRLIMKWANTRAQSTKVINGSVVTTALTKQYSSTTLQHTREICTDHIRQLQATAENEHLYLSIIYWILWTDGTPFNFSYPKYNGMIAGLVLIWSIIIAVSVECWRAVHHWGGELLFCASILFQLAAPCWLDLTNWQFSPFGTSEEVNIDFVTSERN